ncbi:Uncharacterised protein [Mycobacteroides abscessus subsp. abscessus]|nr:Uncharacterised protein [Mycobacteroides abscessus subsp. abscessus]
MQHRVQWVEQHPAHRGDLGEFGGREGPADLRVGLLDQGLCLGHGGVGGVEWVEPAGRAVGVEILHGVGEVCDAAEMCSGRA